MIVAARIKEAIEIIKKLSADEKALIARCPISSLETRQDENVEGTWADLAEKRYAELISRGVDPVSWEEIKSNMNS